MNIIRVSDWNEYFQAWSECMKDIYWYSKQHCFDYNRNEEIEDIREEFHKPDNVFLIASEEASIGVIGLKIRGKRGTIRRWEPAVPEKYRGLHVAESLIVKALEIAKIRGVESIHTNIKYPYGSQEPWLCNEYRKQEFTEQKKMVNFIKKIDYESSTIPSLDMNSSHNYSVDEVTEFTLRAFASTLEDIEIHGKDLSVSDPVIAKETITIQRAGKMGKSLPELGQVALIDGEPAGFIRCFIREEKYRPDYGLIGILGVFPEYRRKGIGTALVNYAITKFKEYGLQYAYVGTKENNHQAMKAYTKAGFQPLFRQITFEKRIN